MGHKWLQVNHADNDEDFWKTGRKIITNFELFTGLSEGIFAKVSELKILGSIKIKTDIFGFENINQEEKININQEERDITQKMSEIMTVLQNPI